MPLVAARRAMPCSRVERPELSLQCRQSTAGLIEWAVRTREGCEDKAYSYNVDVHGSKVKNHYSPRDGSVMSGLVSWAPPFGLMLMTIPTAA